MSDAIDLQAYADRIGYSGAFEPNLKTLQSIARCHVASIPFENCSVLLSHPVLLDTPSLHRKLIEEKRGGYCFEQNTYLLEVLAKIGFKTRPFSARVRQGVTRDFLPARTHLFAVVTLDGIDWIMDVGVGSGSLSTPIRFELDTVQQTQHEPRRIVKEDGRYFHQCLRDDWEDIYEFTGEEMPMIDRQVGNWWTSTNPNSKFKNNLFAALSLPGNERKTVVNTIFTHRRGSETLRTWTFRDSAHVMETLREEFGIALGSDVIVPCPGLFESGPPS